MPVAGGVAGLGGLLPGGVDPTPLCGDLPILCKAPAQPGSLLAGIMGYAVVGVNVRGTGCSGGAYDFFEDLQVLDGYDVIETIGAQDWVARHRVGMVGLSYPGLSQLFVAQSQPPSLAAITPLSVFGDTGTGVLRPGGLLNTGFAVSWANQVLSNAEPSGTSWVRQLIADGKTVLFISHDMAVIERVSHRVAVMYLGQIVEIGPRRAVFENPQHPYTRRLMAAVPVADPTRGRRKRELSSAEIGSPIRDVGDEPEILPMREVGPGHFVAESRIAGSA